MRLPLLADLWAEDRIGL